MANYSKSTNVRVPLYFHLRLNVHFLENFIEKETYLQYTLYICKNSGTQNNE